MVSYLMNQDTVSNPALQRYDPRECLEGSRINLPVRQVRGVQFTVKELSEALETVKFPMT